MAIRVEDAPKTGAYVMDRPKRRLIRTVLIRVCLILLPICLGGCWDETDHVTIKRNGDIDFKSTFVITETSMPKADVDKISDDFVNDFRKAGFKIEKKWLSESKPFKLEFSGSANIKTVRNMQATDFYTVKSVGNSTYSLRLAKGNPSNPTEFSRTVTFVQPTSAQSADITTQDGKSAVGQTIKIPTEQLFMIRVD